MSKKFLKLILSIFAICSSVFVFSASAQKKETVMVKYEYKNKNMSNDKEKNSKTDEYGKIYDNDTSEKEFLNLYILINELFSTCKIDEAALKDVNDFIINPRKNLKLTGELYFDLSSEEKNKLKNYLNKDLTNLKIKEQEFLNYRKEVVNLLENKIEKIKNYSKKEKKLKFGKEYEKYLRILLNRVKNFKNVKFNEISNLTKDLKVNKTLKEFGKLLP